jgi:hypothetical protein
VCVWSGVRVVVGGGGGGLTMRYSDQIREGVAPRAIWGPTALMLKKPWVPGMSSPYRYSSSVTTTPPNRNRKLMAFADRGLTAPVPRQQQDPRHTQALQADATRPCRHITRHSKGGQGQQDQYGKCSTRDRREGGGGVWVLDK